MLFQLVGIYKARHLPTGNSVAIKKVYIYIYKFRRRERERLNCLQIKVGRHGEYTDWAEPAAENEMQMLRKLDHPNVIKV